MRLLLLLLCLIGPTIVEGKAKLFSYGISHGDQLIDFSTSWSAVNLQIPIPYMERQEQDMFISTRGMITFQELETEEYLNVDSLNRSSIAILYVPAATGKTYFRATTEDQLLLRRLTDTIRHEFADAHVFTALEAVVITWEGLKGKEKHGENTFQLVIATDGIESYVFLLYARIGWAKSKGRFAQAAFTHFDGRFQGLMHSGTDKIRELAEITNVDQDGVFIFRVSGTSIEEPNTGGEYEYETDGDGEYVDDTKAEATNRKDCPPNPYGEGECPSDCQLLHDDDGCALCVCAHQNHERRRRPPMEAVAPPPETKQFDDQTTRARVEEEVEETMAADDGEIDEIVTSTTSTAAVHLDHYSEQCSFCHKDANCQGKCCACRYDHFGNGLECLKRGDPQRISGRFHGTINGQEIEETDLHTFITTNDGKAYTAISNIHGHLGQSFLLLQPIGSVMGWLFAETTTPQSKNGFDLTGGLFNRTSTVHFDDRYSVTIEQTFSGRDIYHYFKALVAINGNLPELAEGTRIGFADHETEYRRERAGGVRAYTLVTVTIAEPNKRERSMRMIVDDTITYRECTHAEPGSNPDSVKIRVEQIQVTYDAEDKIVRYASKNVVDALPRRAGVAGVESLTRRQHGETQFQPDTPVPAPTHPSGGDPCAEGAHRCTLPNMFCRAADSKYRCECEHGYTAKKDTASPIGWSCADLDECARGDHDCDAYAVCINTPGSFSCECRAGFEGDGFRCFQSESSPTHPPVHHPQQTQSEPERASADQPTLPDSALPAGHCARHDQCHQWGECVWGQAGQTVGICRCRGWYVGDGVSHCGPPEEVAANPAQNENPETRGEEDEGRRRQLMNAGIPQHGGRACGSYICSPHAECMPSPDGGSECVCRSGFHGNGVFCESLTGDAEGQDTPPQLGQIGTVCRAHEDCHEHATCAYSATVGYYQCECAPPYQGDGMTCTAPGAERTAVGAPASGARPGCDVTNDCSPHADCVFERTPEGADHFKCVCRSGFYGDGWRCTGIDLSGGSLPLPPVSSPGCDTLRNCHTEAQCVHDSHNNKYVCECRPGYTGDGTDCVRTSEATHEEEEGGKREEPEDYEREDVRPACRDASDCHSNAHCVDDGITGGYVCECLPGYRGDGVQQCVVADQCSPVDAASCASNSECVYGQHERAYVCKCVEGFTGDGKTCIPHAPVQTCRENARLCHANAQCVHDRERNTHVCICRPGSIGDGYNQCTPRETPRCGNCSTNGYCAQSENGAWGCKCNAGYAGNGHVCVPFTSCLTDKSICHANAECVPGEGGHYVCNCHYGYNGNGRSCVPDSTREGDQLLIARGMAVYKRGVHADVPGKQLVIVPHQIAVGVDFDCADERIVWSDITGHTLRSAALNGSDTKAAFTDILESPEGVAVDWSSRNVYYADSARDEIGVLSLDGKYQKSLLNEGLHNPRALAIDLQNKHLFYSDWHRAHPVIGRIDLDGKNPTQFVNTDIHLPNGLTILHQRRELCWVDAGAHTLSCIGLDGRGRRTVFADLQYPFGLTAVNEQRFYWTDWKDNRIHSVSVYGEAYESFPISVGGTGKAYGLLSVPKQCIGAPTACSTNNGGCSYLCLPSSEGAHCACPDNKKGLKGC